MGVPVEEQIPVEMSVAVRKPVGNLVVVEPVVERLVGVLEQTRSTLVAQKQARD